MASLHLPLPLALPKSNTLIRPFAATESEALSLSTQANNPKIAQYMRNAFPHPYTLQSAESWITYTNSQNPTYDFAIADAASGQIIGAIGLKPRSDVFYRSMEIGYWVGESHWGRGIAGEAVRVFSEWAFREFGQVVRLEAEVFEGNDASLKVLERAGYVFEGRKRGAVEKNGKVLDTVLYSRLR